VPKYPKDGWAAISLNNSGVTLVISLAADSFRVAKFRVAKIGGIAEDLLPESNAATHLVAHNKFRLHTEIPLPHTQYGERNFWRSSGHYALNQAEPGSLRIYRKTSY
jgi:hypothetical protein